MVQISPKDENKKAQGERKPINLKLFYKFCK